MLMDHYDEELYENSFFQTIQHSFSNILDLVSVSGWMVLVPCKNSLKGLELSLDNIESHIVKAQEDDPNEFYTLNKKELVIRSGIISTGGGFPENRQAKVLFEELFYNNEDGSYRVLCISSPLQGGVSVDDQNANEVAKFKKTKIDVSQLNFEDSCQHLWGFPRGAKIKYQLTVTLGQLAKELDSSRGLTLEETVDKVRKTYEAMVKFLLRTPQFKKTTSHYGMFLALETFIMHRIYRQLMRLIGLHTKERDFKLNKITRNLTNHLDLQHLGIILNNCSLDRSRIILNNFARHITPNAKIYQLRKVFYSLLYSLPAQDGNFSAMTSDELIPVCAFLIAKSNTNNWWCHLLLMRNFCFSVSHFDQELEYFLTTLEASMMFLMSDKISSFDIWSEIVTPMEFSPNESPLVKDIFQCIMENNLIGLEELNSKVEASKDQLKMCHPLCSCPLCTKGSDLAGDVYSVKQALRVFNEAGFTALHISCILSHHDIVDWLLNNGANVNDVCRLGYQPLHLACIMGFQVLVLLLLSHGADIQATDANGNNALHVAVFHGHLQCVKALIFVDQPTKKLDVNAINKQLDTPLHIAARWGYEEICECLLESGASCLKRNKQQLLPSDLVPDLSLCQLILKAVADEDKMAVQTNRKYSLVLEKNSRLSHSRNSLQPDSEFGLTQSLSESSSSPMSSSFSSSSSSKASQVRRAKRLFAERIDEDCNSRSMTDKRSDKKYSSHEDGDDDDDDESTIFNSLPHDQHSANACSPLKVAVDNVKSGGGGDDDDDEDNRGLIGDLLIACRRGNIDKVKSLLRWTEYEQDNPEAVYVDVAKVKLCHPLCQCEKCIHAQWLSPSNQKTSNKVNVNTTSSTDGLSPLHVSCKCGHVELARLLLMRGASVDCVSGTTSRGSSPIHLACQQPSAKIIHLLIQYGADVNAVDGFDNCALHLCSLHHYFRHALLLLLFGAKVDKLNIQNQSPLHKALKSGDANMVFLLLLFGADPINCTGLQRFKSSSTKRALAENVLLATLTTEAQKDRFSTHSRIPNIIEGLPLEFLRQRRRRKSWNASSYPESKSVCKERRRRGADDSVLVQSLEASRWCSHLSV